VGHGFEGAGSREVLLKPVDLNFQLAGTGGAAEAAEFALLFGPLTRILPDLPPEQHQAVRAALVEASRRWTGILPQRSIMQRRSFPLVRSCKRYGKPARLGRSCSRPAPYSRGSRFPRSRRIYSRFSRINSRFGRARELARNRLIQHVVSAAEWHEEAGIEEFPGNFPVEPGNRRLARWRPTTPADRRSGWHPRHSAASGPSPSVRWCCAPRLCCTAGGRS
jgi:hypothetical protein